MYVYLEVNTEVLDLRSELQTLLLLLLLLLGNATRANPGTRVPENPGNPPVFKPVNPAGFVCGEKPGVYGFNLKLKCGQKL